MTYYRNKRTGRFSRKHGQIIKQMIGFSIMALMFITPFLVSDRIVFTAFAVETLIHADTQEVLMEHYLDKLADCESGGILESERDAIVILDSNDWNSRGRLQFQYPTADYYLNKFDLMDPAWEQSDIINLLHTKEFSYMLAAEILIRDGAWQNWVTCGKRTGLDIFVEQYL